MIEASAARTIPAAPANDPGVFWQQRFDVQNLANFVSTIVYAVN
jgi:hypothetical protein